MGEQIFDASAGVGRRVWMENMRSQGYVIRESNLCKLLNITPEYCLKLLHRPVCFAKLYDEREWQDLERRIQRHVYYEKESLRQWFLENVRATRQVIVIDHAPFMSEVDRQRYYAYVNQNGETGRWRKAFFRSVQARAFGEPDISVVSSQRNLPEIELSFERLVNRFGFLGILRRIRLTDYRFGAVRNGTLFANREVFYRHVYEIGAIKLSIGSTSDRKAGKSFFMTEGVSHCTPENSILEPLPYATWVNYCARRGLCPDTGTSSD